jgi:hypothetical protein
MSILMKSPAGPRKSDATTMPARAPISGEQGHVHQGEADRGQLEVDDDEPHQGEARAGEEAGQEGLLEEWDGEIA